MSQQKITKSEACMQRLAKKSNYLSEYASLLTLDDHFIKCLLEQLVRKHLRQAEQINFVT